MNLYKSGVTLIATSYISNYEKYIVSLTFLYFFAKPNCFRMAGSAVRTCTQLYFKFMMHQIPQM